MLNLIQSSIKAKGRDQLSKPLGNQGDLDINGASLHIIQELGRHCGFVMAPEA